MGGYFFAVTRAVVHKMDYLLPSPCRFTPFLHYSLAFWQGCGGNGESDTQEKASAVDVCHNVHDVDGDGSLCLPTSKEKSTEAVLSPSLLLPPLIPYSCPTFQLYSQYAIPEIFCL